MRATAPRGVFVGLTTLDVVYAVPSYPSRNEKVTASESAVATGGPAANAAVTFAALGGLATLVSLLGKSDVGRFLHRELTSLGVDVIDLAPEQTDPPPVSSVIVTHGTGERAVVGSDAVHTEVETSSLNPNEVRTHCDVVLIDGHYPNLAVFAASHAQCPLVVDAGRWKPVMSDLLPYKPEMVCSNDFHVPGTSGRMDTVRALQQSGIDTVVVTDGGDDIVWWNGNQAGRVTPPKTEVIDSLGAGDVFHGAYAYYRCLPDLDIERRLERAATIAALRCSLWGIRSWISQIPESVR